MEGEPLKSEAEIPVKLSELDGVVRRRGGSLKLFKIETGVKRTTQYRFLGVTSEQEITYLKPEFLLTESFGRITNGELVIRMFQLPLAVNNEAKSLAYQIVTLDPDQAPEKAKRIHENSPYIINRADIEKRVMAAIGNERPNSSQEALVKLLDTGEGSESESIVTQSISPSDQPSFDVWTFCLESVHDELIAAEQSV